MEKTHNGIKKCSKCGVAKSPKDNFCPKCGSKLIIYCTVCGKELPEAYPYCPFTGNKMEYKKLDS